jgi:hypothetical protein
MQKVSIKIHIPKKAAVEARSIIYGDTEFEPTVEQMAELGSGDAAALLHFEGADARERLQLRGYSPDLWPLIKEALRNYVTECAVTAQKRADRASARIGLFNWLCANPHLQAPAVAAAMKDYDVSSRYVFELGRQIAEIDTQLGGMKPPLITCYEQLQKNTQIEKRDNPSLFALTLATRLVVAVATDYRAAELPGQPPTLAPDTSVSVSPVSRLTTADGQHQTVVIATVAHPATPYSVAIVWSAEDNRGLSGAIQELRDPGPEV